MANALFDNMKFLSILTDSGMPENQAKAILCAFREATNVESATKSDVYERERVFDIGIREFRAELTGSIRELKNDMNELKSDLRLLELSMTIRLGVMLAFVIVAIAFIVKL